jgi:inosine-uridine nucleoside N-ribohydrolase
LNFAKNRYEQSAIYLHDPLAVGVVIDPSLVATEGMHIEVETEGAITAGMTVADRRLIRPQFKKNSNAEVCISVDAPRFLSFFLERLLN